MPSMASISPSLPASDLKALYVESLTRVERLHRRILDVIKDEFEATALHDITSSQALLLLSIGKDSVAAGDLRTHGYYLGSNVSYNLKKLANLGYVVQTRSATDGRSVRVSLTDRGLAVADRIDDLYQRHVAALNAPDGMPAEDIHTIHRALRLLDRFLTDRILYRL